MKQSVLKEYAGKYNLRILVETGTFYGDMVNAMKEEFDQIYSIELSQCLYKKCVRRFKGDKKIIIIQGDSGVEIKNVVDRIQRPALFWLDGHYSAGITAKGENETPICKELSHILNAPIRNHVIVIDDAWKFGSDPAYPSIEELTQFVMSRRDDLEITIKYDSIRITPKQGVPGSIS